jgi:VanZ family protein
MGLIFFASSVPGDQLPGHFWDKLVHFLVYAVLGVLFLIPLAEARLAQVTTGKAGMAVMLSTLYGAFDEVHQAFTPERTPDVRDLFADALGATLGVVAILLLRVIVKRFQRSEESEV